MNWPRIRLKYVCAVNPLPPRLPADRPVSFVPMEAVAERGGIDATRARPAGAVSSGYTGFVEGDVLVAKITPCFENGKGSIATKLIGGVGFGTTELHVLRASGCDHRWLFYVTQGHEFMGRGKGSMYGAGGQKRVPPEFVRDFRAVTPDVGSQRAIADFLDRKTAAIDALVEKKARLVELLAERRVALIHRAVTRGLDPDAPMKESGIPWIHKIPVHWEVQRARFLFRQRRLDPPTGAGVVTAFRDGEVTLRANRRTEGYTFAIQELGYQGVKVGDLVINSMDAFAGAIGVSDSEGKCTGEYVVCKPLDDTHQSPYFAAVLRWMAQQNYIFVICPSVRERAPRFRFSKLQDVLLPVPPSHEQEEIITSIEAIGTKTDALDSAIRSQIDRLKEYRQALITAAVTGQLDIPGAAA